MGTNSASGSQIFNVSSLTTRQLTDSTTALSILKTEIETNNIERTNALVEKIVSGLSNSSCAEQCSSELVNIYTHHPDNPLQLIILDALMSAEKTPLLQECIESILSDSTPGSLSMQIDDKEKAELKMLISLEGDDRSQRLIEKIKEASKRDKSDNHLFDFDSDPTSFIKRSFNPWNDPIKETADAMVHPSQTVQTICDAARHGPEHLPEMLKSALRYDPEVGRLLGDRMSNDESLQKVITRAVVSIFVSQNNDPVIELSARSYVHQLGEDKAIKLASPGDREIAAPKLLGKDDGIRNHLLRDDLKSDIDHGKIPDLNTLSSSGFPGLSIIWKVYSGHKIQRKKGV